MKAVRTITRPRWSEAMNQKARVRPKLLTSQKDAKNGTYRLKEVALRITDKNVRISSFDRVRIIFLFTSEVDYYFVLLAQLLGLGQV